MITVASNINLEKNSDKDINFPRDDIYKKGNIKLLQILTNGKIKEYQAFIFFNPSTKEFLLSAIISLFFKKKTFLFDANLKKPRNFFENLLCIFKGTLINRCTAFIVMHKNTSEYIKYFRIDIKKITYVPFKSNCYEIMDNIEIVDGGYILSCGASHRDYDCFIRAVSSLKIPVKIVLPNEAGVLTHKSKLLTKEIPTHITIMRHDFSKSSWYEILRKASIVVIPIEEDCIQPAGISVYLEAMSLKKPVIVSKSPSTDGLISNQAILVERGNSNELREAIENLIDNPELAEKTAALGKEYADSLKGVERLVGDLKKIILQKSQLP